MKKFCAGKSHIVANLDRKEYLIPQAYEQFQLDCVDGVMSGLLITLTPTGEGGGDLPCLGSVGVWAGDRITLCTPDHAAG